MLNWKKSISFNFYPSIHPLFHLSPFFHLSFPSSTIHSSIHSSSFHPFIHQSIQPSIYSSCHPFNCPSIRPSIHTSIHQLIILFSFRMATQYLKVLVFVGLEETCRFLTCQKRIMGNMNVLPEMRSPPS